MRPTMLLAVSALVLGATAPVQASSHTSTKHTEQAAAAGAYEFSAAKRAPNPYQGQATIYNPSGAWGPPSAPGTYGGGF
jgi:hypothetical protein